MPYKDAEQDHKQTAVISEQKQEINRLTRRCAEAEDRLDGMEKELDV